MQISELRIGNIINGRIGIPIKVDIGILRRISRLNVDDPSYEPQPLTEEWLEGFGFTKIAGRYELELDTPFILQYAHGKLYLGADFGDSMPMPVEYVHQLQNLVFALTGREIIYKNEK